MTAAKKNSLKGLGWDKSTAAETPETTGRSDEERGLVKVIFRMSKDGKKQIDFLAVELGMKKQEILCEAVNDWLQKHGKHRTA